MNINEVGNFLEIRLLMDRYAIACDSCDWELYRSVFTADCIIDYSEFGGPRTGIDETIAWLSAGLSKYAGLHHNMTTHHCEIDGDQAKAVTYFIAYQTSVSDEGETIMELGGFYKDRLIKSELGWRIAERLDLGTWLRTPVVGRLSSPPRWYGTMDHHKPQMLEN